MGLSTKARVSPSSRGFVAGERALAILKSLPAVTVVLVGALLLPETGSYGDPPEMLQLGVIVEPDATDI